MPATQSAQPLSVETLIRTGLRAERDGNLIQAFGLYARALTIEPQHANTWARIGMILVQGMKWGEALEQFKVARQFDPDDVDAIHGQAIAYAHLGQPGLAREHADLACRLAPAHPAIHASRAYLYATTTQDPDHTLALYRQWGERFADPFSRQVAPWQNKRTSDRKLRIGYVTADFREHSVAYFMEPVLAHHDPDAVEVHVYSSGRPDAVTDRLRRLVPHWHDVREVGDDDLAKMIRRHRIDVLIDLSGHTVGHRLFVFARRPAPVQVTWLGFMHTLGMTQIDYRITDLGVDPPGNERFYVEKLFRVGCMASYGPPAGSPLRPQPPMLERGYPTFASLNNSKKLTDEMLSLWGRILAARPQSRLLLIAQEDSLADARAQTLPRLQRLGLPVERIDVSQRLSLEDFMKLGTQVDVALDTAPLSGGTTTLHSVWMGLPVVTLDAEEAANAASARTLQGLGYPEWVARDSEAYVDLALALADDPARLTHYRAGCRTAMQTSALMDYRTRTRELEHAFRLMWLNFLAGRPLYLSSDCHVPTALQIQ